MPLTCWLKNRFYVPEQGPCTRADTLELPQNVSHVCRPNLKLHSSIYDCAFTRLSSVTRSSIQDKALCTNSLCPCCIACSSIIARETGFSSGWKEHSSRASSSRSYGRTLARVASSRFLAGGQSASLKLVHGLSQGYRPGKVLDIFVVCVRMAIRSAWVALDMEWAPVELIKHKLLSK